LLKSWAEGKPVEPLLVLEDQILEEKGDGVITSSPSAAKEKQTGPGTHEGAADTKMSPPAAAAAAPKSGSHSGSYWKSSELDMALN
jgi:hypothetical protein